MASRRDGDDAFVMTRASRQNATHDDDDDDEDDDDVHARHDDDDEDARARPLGGAIERREPRGAPGARRARRRARGRWHLQGTVPRVHG